MMSVQYAIWVKDHNTYKIWRTYNKEVVKWLRNNFLRKLRYKEIDGGIIPSEFTVKEMFKHIEKSAGIK